MTTRTVTLFVLVMTLLAVHPAAAQFPTLPQLPAGAAAAPAAVPAPGSPTGEAGPPAAPAAPQAGLSLVGQFGGPIYRSTLVGTTLYLGGGTRLVVMDVSNPAAPTIVGQSADLGGEVWDMAIAGDYAYVGVGDVGIATLAIADPAHPAHVGTYEEDSSYYNQITLHGSHAYVAGGYSGLLVLDAANPLALVETSIYTTTSYVNSVVISGTTAYLGAGDTGLQMLGIADPAHPTYLGAYTRASLRVEDVEVHGPYAYLAASDDGLLIVDITDPLSPTLVGEMPVGWNDVGGLTVSGDYAYLALDGYGLSIVDVSNPAAPSQVGAIHTRDSSAWDVTLVGAYAYLTAYDDGLHVFDVANPAAPTLAYLYDIPSEPRDIAVAGNYAYLADGWDVLHSVDISNPASPVEGDLYYVAGGVANTLDVSGTLAYVGDGSGLHIIDISDPLSLTHVSSLVLLGGGEDVVISGSYAYVAAGGTGIHIVDVSDPAAPVKESTIDTPGFAGGITVVGQYAYVADKTQGVRIVDVSDPAAPVEVGFYVDNPYRWVSAVAVAYPYVYLGTGVIVDASDPYSPTLAGYFAVTGSVENMTLEGNLLYVPRFSEGFTLLDLTDRLNPAVVAHYETPDYSWSVARQGDYLYLANDFSGMVVLEYSASTTYRAHLPLVARNASACFQDDFSNPASGWQVGAGAGWSVGYLDGEYQILVTENGAYATGTPLQPLPADYRLEVDARLTAATLGSYGLLFGGDEQEQTGYAFVVLPTEQGYVITRQNADGTFTTLEDEDSTPVVNPGTAANRLRVDRIGSSIHAFVNGVLVATWDDDSYMGAGLSYGLVAYSYDEGAVDARFDNFSACPTVLASPLFVDDFSVSGRWYVADHGWGKFSYQEGEYEILIRNTDSWGYADVPLEGGLPRFALEADTRLVTGTQGLYGLNFGQVDGEHFYNFRVYPAAQQYALFQVEGSTWTPLVGWTVSAAINAGAAANHLRVERDGEQIRLYANGVLLNSLADSSYLGNQEMSLYAGSWTEAPVAMRYDNVTFSELP